jgi:hypothetical protein
MSYPSVSGTRTERAHRMSPDERRRARPNGTYALWSLDSSDRRFWRDESRRLVWRCVRHRRPETSLVADYSGPIGTVGPVGALGVAVPATVDSEPKE